MSIHQGHRERVKAEFLQGGLSHFSEHRVLELLLFYSRHQGDVNPLAHRLLDTFGSLSGVLDADTARLLEVPGVGENTVTLLKLIPAICAKYVSCRASADTIIEDSPAGPCDHGGGGYGFPPGQPVPPIAERSLHRGGISSCQRISARG